MTVAAPAVWPRLEDVVDPIRDDRRQHRPDHLPGAQGRGRRQPRIAPSAFAIALRASGRNVRVVVPEPLPRLLEYLPGFETVETGGAPLGDTVFTFDCATLGRFGERRAEVEHATTVVNIDHHLSNTGFGTHQPRRRGGQRHRSGDLPACSASSARRSARRSPPTSTQRCSPTPAASATRTRPRPRCASPPRWSPLEPTPDGSRSRATSRAPSPRCASRAWPSRRCTPRLDGRLLWSEVTLRMLEQTGADMQDAEGIIDALQSIGNHADRDPLQGDAAGPHQDQRAHARAHRRDRRLHAVRRRRPPPRRRRRVRGSAPRSRSARCSRSLAG